MLGKIYFWLLDKFGFPEPLTNFFRKGYDNHPLFWAILLTITCLIWALSGAFIAWFIYHIIFEDKEG